MSTGTVSAIPQPWDSIECDDRPVRVEVDGIHIPVTMVRTELTKEGPAHINRLTEVVFPHTWEGHDVLQYLDSFDPTNQDAYDTVRVEWQSDEGDDFETTQFGYVRGVGGTDNSLEMKLWVSDPSTLTTAIPYTSRFEDFTHISTAFEGLGRTFENQSAFAPVNVDVTSPVVANISPGRKSFTGNRDTLKDGLDYIAERVNSWWYFEWRREGLTLVLDSTPILQNPDEAASEIDAEARRDELPIGVTEREAPVLEDLLTDVPTTRTTFVGNDTNLEGVNVDWDESLTLIDNDAITEILPINALRANGKTATSEGLLPDLGNSLGGWPTAKVRYEPLYRRAGNNEYHGSIQEVDAKTIAETERVARSKLKQALQSTGEGDMTVRGTPTIRPYDRVIARPECANTLNQTPPLDYEVTSVTHEASGSNRAKDGTGPIYRTRLGVTLFVDESRIETVESKMVSH